MVDKRLKKIVFEGRTFYYRVICESGDYGDYYYTKFYKTNDVVKYRPKYYLFGPSIPVPANKKVFRVEINIEDCRYTKKEVRDKIARKVEILDRCKEIKNGDII